MAWSECTARRGTDGHTYVLVADLRGISNRADCWDAVLSRGGITIPTPGGDTTLTNVWKVEIHASLSFFPGGVWWL